MAAASLGTSGGIVNLDCERQYRLSASLDLTKYPGVVLKGCLASPDDPLKLPGYAGSLATLGGLLRDPSATILVGRDSGLRNLVVRQSDISIPTADVGRFAGTAIATPGGGAGRATLLDNVLVLGAATCFDDRAGGDRLHIDGFYCDGIDGETIGPSYDTSVITNVHNWPYATGGAEPKLRTGVGLTIRGASDDTVLGTIFDYGHRVGFLFDSRSHGKFHVTHLWADNNADACVRVAGGRGINIASLTAYTCGVSIDVAKQAEVQITQAFLVSSEQECVRVDGTLSFALLHIERCKGGGIRVLTPASALSVGFLQPLGLRGPWTISVPPGFTGDHIGIGKLFTDAAAGTSLYEGQGPADPLLQAAPTLDLPPNADAVRLDGQGAVQTLRGGWGGRTVTITTANPNIRVGTQGNVVLTNGISFGARAGGLLCLRYDAASGRWREVSRSIP